MRIEREECLTATEAGELDRKRFWWVMNVATDKLVHLGRWTPGTQRLSTDLEPGSYTIGCGTPEYYRERITVTPDGVTSDRDPQTLPCITVACAGVLEVPSMVSVPGCEPFELRPPRERQCGACRGAS